MECRGCKGRRLRKGLEPRKMYQVAKRVTDHDVFSHRVDIPLLLCPECDGPTLQRSIETHRLRMPAKAS